MAGPSGGLRLKLMNLACVVWVGAFALCGCHSDNPADPSAVSGGGTATAAVPVGAGTATVSWEAPTTTTAGGVLNNLAGYRIYYGLSRTSLTQAINLVGTDLQSYVVDHLGTGTWYFAVRAVTAIGVESDLSEIVSKTIE